MDVLICGAGIAGPTLAWWLARAGMHITVLEKAPRLLDAGQNIDIDGSARTIIRRMGLEGEIRRLNTGEQGTVLLGPNTRPIARFPVKAGFDVSPTSEFEILRGDLARIFYNAAKDQPNINFLFDTTIAQVLSNDEEMVKVELSNGKVLTVDLLVAADGQWSRTRRQCLPPDVVGIRDMNLVGIYGTIPRQPSDTNCWTIYQSLGRRIVSTRPDSHGTLRTFLTIMPANANHRKEWYDVARQDKDKQVALLRRDFIDAGWESQRIVEATEKSPDFYVHAIQQMRLTKWSHQRVVCLGDAAYAPTPLTGMGTPLAILGAYVLAGELSELQPGEHPERALTAYHAKFKPFVEKVQDLPSYVPGIVHPNGRWHRWVCQCVIRFVAVIISIPWVVNRCRSTDYEDFELPQYAAFANVGVSTTPGSVGSEK